MLVLMLQCQFRWIIKIIKTMKSKRRAIQLAAKSWPNEAVPKCWKVLLEILENFYVDFENVFAL